MARKTHSQDSTRRDAALLKHFREACEPFENIKKTIAMASGRRKSEERSLLFMRAVEELERAERAVCNLFEEGATWQRKFDGLEEACGTDRRVDLETVAWLYWSCKRFFETGLPALVSVQESVQQCEHCRQAIGLPFAILGSNLKRMREVLQQAGATMPELCLTIGERKEH